MKQHTRFYLLALAILVLASCNEKSSKNTSRTGTIEYSIQFKENNESKVNTSMLPNRITIKFRNNSTSNKIEGLSGSVNLTFINNVEEKSSIVLVNLWSKKLYFKDSSLNKNLPNPYAGMSDISIEKTDEIVRFNGFNCKKAIAHYKDSSDYSFDILYTNEICIANPNANTPFESIDGVMLKFNIKLKKYLMSITSTSVKFEEVSVDEFTVPSGYEKVSKRTIEDLVFLMQ
ncbi:MAG: hypothetical protein EHM93_03895 [Bacteroidales bacterium]|nr:MAG: hypothetical protein EHM93_03895 [Bacteroidales bacterium]